VNEDFVIDSDHHPTPMPRNAVHSAKLPSFNVQKEDIKSTQESIKGSLSQSTLLKALRGGLHDEVEKISVDAHHPAERHLPVTTRMA
jgi:hypothetical protein